MWLRKQILKIPGLQIKIHKDTFTKSLSTRKLSSRSIGFCVLHGYRHYTVNPTILAETEIKLKYV